MWVVYKQFQLMEFVLNYNYVDLKYNDIYNTFTAGSMCLCCVCNHVVVLGTVDTMVTVTVITKR